VRDALGRILDLPGARDDLRATVDARTDDEGVFYVRLDKQEAFAGRLALTRGEDAIQLRLKLETYPATRERALEALGRLLEMERP
jgi:RNA binding exosome subunit